MDASVSRYLGDWSRARVVVVTGDAAWLVEREAAEVAAWASQWAQPAAMNVTSLHAGESDSAAGLGVVTAEPMLAHVRVVALRNLHDATDAVMERLCAYAVKPTRTTILVVSGRATPAVRKGGTAWGQRLSKALAEGGGHWAKVADGVDPVRFVQERAWAAGKGLDAPVARLLIEVVGLDLGTLAAETDKLVTYAGAEPEVTRAHVQAAGTMTAEADVFDLTGAIVSHDVDAAVRVLTRLMEDGEPAERLIATVGWQVRQVLLVQDMRLAGRPEREIREAARMPGHAWDRLRAALDAGVVDTAVALERLARASRALHRHKAGERLVLERLVLDLAGVG